MTLSTEMKKLRESKAFYAAAGARDLAAEKLREVPDQWRRFEGLKGARRELSGRAQSYAVVLTGKAAEVYGDLGSRALGTYEGLAERGRHVVSRADDTIHEGPGQIESQPAPVADSAPQSGAPTRKAAETTRNGATGGADTAKNTAKNTSANAKTDTTKKSS